MTGRSTTITSSDSVIGQLSCNIFVASNYRLFGGPLIENNIFYFILLIHLGLLVRGVIFIAFIYKIFSQIINSTLFRTSSSLKTLINKNSNANKNIYFLQCWCHNERVTFSVFSLLFPMGPLIHILLHATSICEIIIREFGF